MANRIEVVEIKNKDQRKFYSPWYKGKLALIATFYETFNEKRY